MLQVAPLAIERPRSVDKDLQAYVSTAHAGR